METKKCSTKVVGEGYSINVEILIDLNREMTETDKDNVHRHLNEIVNSLKEESIKFNPKSQEQAREEKEGILGLFGDRKIFVEEIPNGYCSQACCKHLPWFVVTTSKGKIKLGWRKRVIQIEWIDSIIDEFAEKLFPNENVTKFDKGIHAWGYEKAKEYIDILLS